MFRLIMRYLRATLTSLGRHGAIALLLLLVASVSACQDSSEPTRTDAEIKEDVVARLEAGSFPDLEAEVADGVVTLRGSAYTQADADRAVSLVKSVLGVTNVESQITVGGVASDGGTGVPTVPAVEPTSPDQLTAAKLTQTFKASPALAGASIASTVVGGVATLVGNVPSEQAKSEAERIAKSVAGVASVDNRLTIKAVEVATVPDKQIEAAVRELIDQSYPDVLITVSVAGGVVKLRGAPDSNKQVLEITDRISKIKGVKAVDTSLFRKEGEDEDERIGAPATK